MFKLSSYIRALEPADIHDAAITVDYLREMCPKDTAKYESDELYDLLELVCQYGGDHVADLVELDESLEEKGLDDFVDMTGLSDESKLFLKEQLEQLDSLGKFLIDYKEFPDE